VAERRALREAESIALCNQQGFPALVFGDVGRKQEARLGRQELTDFNEHHPIHDEVFGVDPDGFVNDTPPGAIGDNVNIIGTAVQPEQNQPMRNLGDSDQGDRQPDGSRRR
jgi:hypothetical protein